MTLKGGTSAVTTLTRVLNEWQAGTAARPVRDWPPDTTAPLTSDHTRPCQHDRFGVRAAHCRLRAADISCRQDPRQVGLSRPDRVCRYLVHGGELSTAAVTSGSESLHMRLRSCTRKWKKQKTKNDTDYTSSYKHSPETHPDSGPVRPALLNLRRTRICHP